MREKVNNIGKQALRRNNILLLLLTYLSPSFYLTTTMIVETNYFQFTVEHVKYWTMCDVNSDASSHMICLPAEVGEFFNFKNYLCKLPIGNKSQLAKTSKRWCTKVILSEIT